jgi:hypothetical protein
MVGALAAILRDAAPKLGELQHKRIVQQSLVTKVRVEGANRVAVGAHEARIGSSALHALGRVRIEPSGLHPVDASAESAHDRTRHGTKRDRQPVVWIGDGPPIVGDRRNKVKGVERCQRGFVDQG